MKIFVAISSYRDILLRMTIMDCYLKAKYKESIVFGIVDQCYDHEIPPFEKLPFKNQIKYFYIHPINARGACFPRHVCQTLYTDEDYYLQIDSHMLFEENWDEKLLDYYNDLKSLGKNPVITTYPSAFTVNPEKLTEYVKDYYSGVLYLVPVIKKSFEKEESYDNYYVSVEAKCIDSDKPLEGYLVGGGFIFSSTEIIEKVPYDPFLFFCGEETSYALRLWTHGYDIFHIPGAPLNHCYERNYNKYMWQEEDIERFRDKLFWERDLDSKKRLKKIVTGDLNSIYGLGKKRTLKEYAKFSGIDYLNKEIKGVIIHK